MPAKIAHRNFFFAISGVVNRHFLTISCLVIIQYQKMAEKIKINLSNGPKKVTMSNFCRHLEIGKVVRLYEVYILHVVVVVVVFVVVVVTARGRQYQFLFDIISYHGPKCDILSCKKVIAII
jgi:hypothetical protein